jgi:hypothetical protein
VISPFAGPVRRVAAGAVCAVLLTGTAGCTSDSDTPRPEPAPLPGASTGAAPTLDAKPVPMQVRVTRVAGKLSKPSRTSLEKNVGRTIGRYFDAAYLSGPGDPFGSFSRGAARQARGDRDLLTNASLAASTQAVAPRQKHAWLSVLAPNKVAAGVTARIRLVYLVDRGEAADRKVRVSGRLMLTRGRAGWEIFGYDVARSAGPVGKGAS